MKRFVLGFLCALSLAIAPACGGDDDDGTSGPDAAGGGFDATAFCTQFGTVCGFGTAFADQAACVAAVGAFDATRQACVQEHLGYADQAADGSADETLHCGHAGGEAPCD